MKSWKAATSAKSKTTCAPTCPFRGARGRVAHREVTLADFYTDYRRNLLRPDELLAWIKVPKPIDLLPAPLPANASGEWTRVYKVSKRREDDISAVCLAVSLQLKQGVVQSARLGAGGVAAAGGLPGRG